MLHVINQHEADYSQLGICMRIHSEFAFDLTLYSQNCHYKCETVMTNHFGFNDMVTLSNLVSGSMELFIG